MTNEELGKRIGVTHSMASRMRGGNRLPGIDTMQRIRTEFNADWDVMMAKRGEGPAAFAAYLEGLITKDEKGRAAAAV